MEGLEAVEINYLNLKENLFFRIDSEFFLKQYLVVNQIISKRKHCKLGELIEFITDGKHGGVTLTENGVLFLRNTNVKEGYIDLSDTRYISFEESAETKRAELEYGDILLTTIGTLIGDAVRVPKRFPIATINQNLVKIRPKNINISGFLTSFFNGEYGKKQVYRIAVGNIWYLVNYPNLKGIHVPLFSDSFYFKIDNLLELQNNISKRSEIVYFTAENLLLKTLGLENFEPGNEQINVKSFKESFQTSGRFDAEYYQKKYENFKFLISSYKNGFSKIKDICTIKDKNFYPSNSVNYKYVELSNIDRTGGINGFTISTGEELPSRARRRIRKNDVIISSIEGSLQSCAIVTGEYDNAICSTGFYVITSEMINSETLLVLFKTELMQNILKQNCSGTILTAINKDEFLNIEIPIIERPVQTQIFDLIQESFRLKKQSEQLLELAKTSVEKAIEENEEAALAFINLEMKKMNVMIR